MSDEDILLSELKETFQLINNWLQFAEAKNGLALAFISGIIYSFNIFESDLNNFVFLSLYFLLILSFLSSLLSFYPNIGTTILLSKFSKIFFLIAEIPKEKIQPIDSNLPEIKSFYGDISKNYEIKDYNIFLEKISKDYYGKNRIHFSTLEKEYAKEIIILSKLTVNKYTYFKSSLKLIIIFTIIFIFVLGYNKVFKDNFYTLLSNNTIVREVPDVKGQELLRLPKAITVKKIGQNKNWIKIEVNEKKGWIHNSLLEKK